MLLNKLFVKVFNLVSSSVNNVFLQKSKCQSLLLLVQTRFSQFQHYWHFGVISPCWGGRPVPCRTLSSTPGLHLQTLIAPPPQARPIYPGGQWVPLVWTQRGPPRTSGLHYPYQSLKSSILDEWTPCAKGSRESLNPECLSVPSGAEAWPCLSTTISGLSLGCLREFHLHMMIQHF